MRCRGSWSTCAPLASWERCAELAAPPPALGRNCSLDGAMRALGWRVDALTLAYRVELDPAFVRALRARQAVANEHRFAGFEWGVLVPEERGSGVLSDRRRLGQVRAVWGEDHDAEIQRTELRTMLWGELKKQTSPGVYRLTNKPYFRLQVLEKGPGASDPRVDAATGEIVSDPGWTLELIWEAQALAVRDFAGVLAESMAIARLCGHVLEQRVRRLDVCADVAGWTIERTDVERLAKRPRARWSREFAAEAEDAEDGTNAQDHGTGALERRRMTGLQVGRGGALMSRIYDKRAELAACGLGLVAQEDGAAVEKRVLEEERWIVAGWDGDAPVTRVEFQIRGAAVDELGLRDPESVLEVFEAPDGRRDRRPVRDASGSLVGLADRLGWIWATCLDWVRLVVPETTRRGRPVAVSRLADDPRWALLRGLSWGRGEARPIRRFRQRGAASAAQALGVSLSQAGKDGLLREWEETAEAYEETRAEEVLRDRVRRLKADEAERIVAWLIDRFGGVLGANVHLAVRANAARLRFRPRPVGGVVRAERGPPSAALREIYARAAVA